MTNSDRLLEAVYDLADRQRSEVARMAAVQAALAAAVYRAARLEPPPPKRKERRNDR
jgi:hypothetical protein